MAITYPLAMPASPAPADAELYIERNQAKIYSFSKLMHVQRNPGDRWIGKLTLPLLSRNQAADWLGFFDALDGHIGHFKMPHPDFTEIRGSAGHEQGMINGAGQLGSTVLTSGWAASSSNLFRRGDMIEIGNKLKRVVSDVSSDISGNATLEVAPIFYSAPSNGTTIRTINPGGLFRLSEGFVQPSSDMMRHHTISFAVEELLP